MNDLETLAKGIIERDKRIRELEADNETLQAMLLGAHERIAAQAELIARASGKPPTGSSPDH